MNNGIMTHFNETAKALKLFINERASGRGGDRHIRLVRVAIHGMVAGLLQELLFRLGSSELVAMMGRALKDNRFKKVR